MRPTSGRILRLGVAVLCKEEELGVIALRSPVHDVLTGRTLSDRRVIHLQSPVIACSCLPAVCHRVACPSEALNA